MFELTLQDHFSSAHNLRGYKGKCENLHGHNWKIEAVISSPRLDKLGMVIDFKELKAALKKVLDRLDHKYLNELVFFKKTNPSAENIAKFIYFQMKNELKSRGSIKLRKIIAWEGTNSSASFS
jgi:6-pyruvoyltetrahydropterin/6-carboxytetrahydropterin synthase